MRAKVLLNVVCVIILGTFANMSLHFIMSWNMNYYFNSTVYMGFYGILMDDRTSFILGVGGFGGPRRAPACARDSRKVDCLIGPRG